MGDVAEGVGDVEVVEFGVGVPLSDGGCEVVAGGVEECEVVCDCCRVALVGCRVVGVSLNREV